VRSARPSWPVPHLRDQRGRFRFSGRGACRPWRAGPGQHGRRL